jgi:hypothetical protein
VEDHGVTHEEWLDEQLTAWLSAGPHDVPAEPIQAAVAHARTHPRRRLPAGGLGRSLMDHMHLTRVEPRATGRRAFAIAGAAVAIAAVIVAGGFMLAGGFGDQPGRVAAPPVPDVTPTPALPTNPRSPSPTTSAAPLPTLPVGVSGVGSCSRTSTGRSSSIDGVTQYRGVVLDCTMTMSDPRLDGVTTVGANIDVRPDQSADIWGWGVVVNDGGRWLSQWAGTVDAGYTTHRMTGVYVGAGGYEGLRLRFRQVTDSYGKFQLTGVLEAVDAVPPDGATVVQGASCTTESQGSQTMSGDVLQYRGVQLVCTGPSSDPRLEGPRRVTVDIDQNPDESATMSGTVEIDGPDGAWTGTFTGTIDPGYTTHRMSGVLVGSGAYTGLQLRYSQIGLEAAGYVLTGTIGPAG